MTMLELLAVNAAMIGTFMILLWLASVALRDVSIVDVFWGFGFAAIASATFLLTGASTARKVLLLVLTATWGLRLTLYLGGRKLGAPEDYRYRSMREKIGPRFWIVSLFLVFGLQGVIMILVALPILAGQLDRSPLNGFSLVGCGVWAAGFLFEAVGDWQLSRFKSDPRNQGKVLDRGLWRYTRHPNYFGDFMVWWGIYLASLGDAFTWWTIISPMLMSLLLLRVSGVTLLESSLRQRKTGYAEYAARTSSFFPWPPQPPRA